MRGSAFVPSEGDDEFASGGEALRWLPRDLARAIGPFAPYLEVRRHRAASGSTNAHALLGIALEDMAKTGLWETSPPGLPVVSIVAADDRVDRARLASFLEVNSVHLARCAERLIGYAATAFPPVGLRGIRVVTDLAVATRADLVWCSAGSPTLSLGLPGCYLASAARTSMAGITVVKPLEFADAQLRGVRDAHAP